MCVYDLYLLRITYDYTTYNYDKHLSYIYLLIIYNYLLHLIEQFFLSLSRLLFVLLVFFSQHGLCFLQVVFPVFGLFVFFSLFFQEVSLFPDRSFLHMAFIS